MMDEYEVQLQSWGPLGQGKEDIFKNSLLAGIEANT